MASSTSSSSTTRVKKKRSSTPDKGKTGTTTTRARTRTKPASKTTTKSKPATKTTKAKTTAKSSSTRKKAAPVAVVESTPKEFTPEGFEVGSDSALIAAALVEGGIDRNEVNANAIAAIEASSGLQTKNGKDKYVPSMVSSILSKMVATGEWQVMASWQLVPVE